MNDDRQLLARYLAEGSEEAFTEIVRQHTGLVYSGALRQMGDPDRARDVTQMVFIHLARKARSIPSGTVLAGWLHRDTRFTALDVLRAETRRSRREQLAVSMNTLDCESSSGWEDIRPLLDEALDELGPVDRDALLLRFFAQRDFAAVGAALGASAEAARKRVDRALERLREGLVRRGITTPAAALGAILSAHALEPLPAGLAASLASSSAAAALAAAAPQAAGTLSMLMMMTKPKLVLGAIAVAGVVATPLLVQERALGTARAEQAALRASVRDLPARGAALAPATAPGPNGGVRNDRGELERLRGQVASLQARVSGLASQARARDAASASRETGEPGTGETLHVAELRDAGQATPAALFQTYLWAVQHGDTNRVARSFALGPETDMRAVQRMLDVIEKYAAQGLDFGIAHSPTKTWRMLEDSPAGGSDRWVAAEFSPYGGTPVRLRTRVRPTDAGWKLVLGANGLLVQQKMEGAAGEWSDVDSSENTGPK